MNIKNKLIKRILAIISIFIIISILLIIRITYKNNDDAKDTILELEKENEQLKLLLKDQINYIDWYKCRHESKTERECFICDSVYDPKQEFIY